MDQYARDSGAGLTPTDAAEPHPAPVPVPAPPARRRNPGAIFWRCTKSAMRLTSYVAAPIAGAFLLLSLLLLAFSAGAGDAWQLVSHWDGLKILLYPFALYFALVLLGGFYGGIVGACAALLVWIWPRWRTPAWWAAASRPIRLRRRGQNGHVPRTRKRLVWPWLAGVPLLLVLAATFGIAVYFRNVVNAKLSRSVAAADRDDPCWRLNDLLAHREAVPDAENSAPVVAEALVNIPDDWPWPPEQPRGVPNPPPTPVSKAYREIGQTPYNVQLADGDANVLRHELNTFGAGLRLARSVAHYSRGRHELRIAPNPVATSLSETRDSRTLARVLFADAALRAHDGDVDGALHSSRAILALGRSIGDEPFLYSQLVRMAIGSVALESMRRALGQGEPTDSALARLQDLVLDESSQPLLLNGVKGERAALVELLRRVGSGEVPAAVLRQSSSGGLSVTVPAITNSPPPLKLWFDCQEAFALDWLNEAVAIARRPAREWRAPFQAWDAEMERVRRSRFGLFTAVIPLILMPAVRASSLSHSRCQAELGAAAILLAAERHRRRTGAWPASIAAIDRDLLPSPPLDPFTGQSFLMERRNGQLLVHSIGPNGKDEHGAFNPRRWMGGGPDDIGTGAWDVNLRALPGRSEQPPDKRFVRHRQREASPSAAPAGIASAGLAL